MFSLVLMLHVPRYNEMLICVLSSQKKTIHEYNQAINNAYIKDNGYNIHSKDITLKSDKIQLGKLKDHH